MHRSVFIINSVVLTLFCTGLNAAPINKFYFQNSQDHKSGLSSGTAYNPPDKMGFINAVKESIKNSAKTGSPNHLFLV